MSLAGPSLHLNSSAAVALRLLTGAGPRQAPELAEIQDKGGVKVADAPAPFAADPPGNTRIRLSLEAAERAYGADSFLMRTARGMADEVEIRIATIPENKETFRAQVIAMLSKSERMQADPGFMAALRSGQIVVHTIDEVPELDMQPLVRFTMYKDGYVYGNGGFTPDGGNWDLYQQLSSTRDQTIGAIDNVRFYAYWPRLA